MIPFINFSLQGQLGVQHMSIDHLKEVAEVALQHFQGQGSSKASVSDGDDSDTGSDFAEDSDEGVMSPRELLVKWIANWLGCVHVLMEEGGVGGSGLHSLMVNTLRDLPVLPLEDGSFVTAAQSGIFFPPDYKGAVECKLACVISQQLSVLFSSVVSRNNFFH
jgi:hypothetical protein